MGFSIDCQFCHAAILCPDGAYRWTVIKCAACGLNNAVRNPQPRDVEADQRRRDYLDTYKTIQCRYAVAR